VKLQFLPVSAKPPLLKAFAIAHCVWLLPVWRLAKVRLRCRFVGQFYKVICRYLRLAVVVTFSWPSPVNFAGALSLASDGHGGSLVTDLSADSSAVSDVVTASPDIGSGDSFSESVTPGGANCVGSVSVAQDSDGRSFDFGFALGKDQIGLAPGQTLDQSYDVSINDAQNPGADVSQKVSVSIGGPGSDNFVFTTGMGADSIVNFDPQQDTIELDHFASAQTVQQLQSLVTSDVHGDAVINLGHSDSITLSGVTTSELQQVIQAGHVLLH
jgi:hypothetical protein